MSVVEIPGGAAPTSGAAGMGSSTASSTSSILGAANHSSFLSASSRALLEKLRANDAKRGAAGKWAEIKNGLFRVSAVGGGSGGAGGPQNVSSSSSAMLQRGQEDHKQVTKKCGEELRKHAPVTSLEMFQEKLEECARNVVNADTNTPMQFTVQHGFDVFLSSDTFYVEIKMNPRARTDPASVVLEDSGAPVCGPKEPLVNAVRIYHTDDPISCSEMVDLLNEENFTEFSRHLRGLMSIYDNFQSETVNRSKIWLSLRALEEDLDVLAQIQGTSSFLKHDVASLVLRAPVGVLSPRVGGRPLTLTYFVSPYDLLDADKKEVIPWSLDTLAAKKLGRRVAVAIEAIPPSTSTSSVHGRSDPNCHRLQHMALLTIKTSSEGKKIPSFASLTAANSSILAARFALRLDEFVPTSISSSSKRSSSSSSTAVTSTSPITAVPMAEELVKTVLEITKSGMSGVRMYDSGSEATISAENASCDLIPLIVEQELRKQRLEIEPKAQSESETLTYKYFGAKNEGETSTSTTPPLKVILPNQTHTYIFNNISPFYSLEGLPRKSLADDSPRKTTFSGFLVGGVAFTHPTMVPQILALLRTQLVFNSVIASCVRIPSAGLSGSDSTKSPSTHHVFEVEALNLYRLSISFEVEEDNDFDGLEEDEELMRQLEEEMIDTMSGEAGGLVSAEINLKEMGQATCALTGSVDPSLLPSNEFATKVLNKTLSIPITMRAVVKKCLELQRERKQKKIKKIRELLNAKAKAAAEAAALAMRQKQIQQQQQQQEKTARVMMPQQTGILGASGGSISSVGSNNQDNDVVITGPPVSSGDISSGPSSHMGYGPKGTMSQPQRGPMSMHGQQHPSQQQPTPPVGKSNDQLLLNLLNSSTSPTSKVKQIKGGKKRKALSSLDMGIPPGAGTQEEPPGIGTSFGQGKSPKQRRIDGAGMPGSAGGGGDMDDSPFSVGNSPYEFPEGGNNTMLQQQGGMAGGAAAGSGPAYGGGHPQQHANHPFRPGAGSRPGSGSSYGGEGGMGSASQQQMMSSQQQQQQMNNANFGSDMQGGMAGQMGHPGQQQQQQQQQSWGQQAKFGPGAAQQGMNQNMNARNPQNIQNYQQDHFLGDGRSASTVAPNAAATSSSDVDRDLAKKGGITVSSSNAAAATSSLSSSSSATTTTSTPTSSSLASTPNIFKNSPLTNRSKSSGFGAGSEASSSTSTSSASSFLAQLAAKKDAPSATSSLTTAKPNNTKTTASSTTTSSANVKRAGADGDFIDLTDDADDDVMICQDSLSPRTSTSSSSNTTGSVAGKLSSTATTTSSMQAALKRNLADIDEAMRKAKKKKEASAAAGGGSNSKNNSANNNNNKKQHQRAGSIERDMTIEWNKDTGGVTTMAYSASDPGSRTPPYNPTKSIASSLKNSSSSALNTSAASSSSKTSKTSASSGTTTPKTKTVSPIKIRTTPEGIITASSVVQPSQKSTSSQNAKNASSLPSYAPSTGRSISPNVSSTNKSSSSSAGGVSRSAPSSANTSPALSTSASKAGSGGPSRSSTDLQSNNFKKTPTVKLKPLNMPSSISSSLTSNKSGSLSKSVSPSLSSNKSSSTSGSGGAGSGSGGSAGNKGSSGSLSAPPLSKSGKNSPNLLNKKSIPSTPLALPNFQPSLPAGLKFTKIKQPASSASPATTSTSAATTSSSGITTTTTASSSSSSSSSSSPNLPRSGSNNVSHNNNKPFGPSPAATASMQPLPPPLPIAPGTSIKTKPPKNKFYGGVSAPPNFSNADHKFNHGSGKSQNVFSSFSDVFDDESGGGGNGGSRASHSEPPQRKNIPSLLSNLSKPTGLNNSGGNATKPTEEKVLKSILKTSTDRSSDSSNRTPIIPTSLSDVGASTTASSTATAMSSGGGTTADEDAKRDSFESSFLSFLSTKENDGGGKLGKSHAVAAPPSSTSNAGKTKPSAPIIPKTITAGADTLDDIDEIASPEMLHDRFNMSGGPVKEISLHEKLSKPPASPASASSVGERSTTPLIPISNTLNDDEEDDDDEKDSLVIDCGASAKTPPSAARSSLEGRGGGGGDSSIPPLISPDGGVASIASSSSVVSSSASSSAGFISPSNNVGAHSMTAVVSATPPLSSKVLTSGLDSTSSMSQSGIVTTNSKTVEDSIMDDGLLC